MFKKKNKEYTGLGRGALASKVTAPAREQEEKWSPLVARIPGPLCGLFRATLADAWTRPLRPGDNLAALAKWSWPDL